MSNFLYHLASKTLLYFKDYPGQFDNPPFLRHTLASLVSLLSLGRPLEAVGIHRSFRSPFAFQRLYQSADSSPWAVPASPPLRFCVPLETVLSFTEALALHGTLGHPHCCRLPDTWVKGREPCFSCPPSGPKSLQATGTFLGQCRVSGRVHVCGIKLNLRGALVTRNRMQLWPT